MTPAQAATRTLSAIEDGDANSLWSMTPPEERRLYGLTEVKLQRLLDLSGFKSELVADGAVRQQENPSDGSFSVGRWYTLGGKSRASLGIVAEIGWKHKVFLRNPVTNLVNFILYSAGLADTPAPTGGESSAAAVLSGIQKKAAILTNVGIYGEADSECTRLVPWSELSAQLEEQCRQTKAERLIRYTH
jgi:hypothetical protein